MDFKKQAGPLFYNFIQQARSAYLIVDKAFTVTACNPAAEQLFHDTALAQSLGLDSSRALQKQNIKLFVSSLCMDMESIASSPVDSEHSAAGRAFDVRVTGLIEKNGKCNSYTIELLETTEQRSVERERAQFKSTANGVTTNLMIADRDGTIVYMNPSVSAMLKKREAQLQQVLPKFKVDSIVGSNMDVFHSNPKKQRDLLGDPSRLPFSADIKVADLEFGLTALALRDEKGRHIGSAVQWQDITEEKDAQRQIDSMVRAAIRGELDRRIDTSNYSGFMQELGDGINNLLESIVAPINASIETATAMSEGDLQFSMPGEYSGEFLALSNAMNKSMDNLRGMVQGIRAASDSVLQASSEISDGNQELTKRAEQQAGNLGEAASSIDQLSNTVKKNAETASQASGLSREAMSMAGTGEAVVSDAVAAMENISEFSKRIADIITVIDEIAFQTNLLALNASVEAARAGDQGRGFAVVASEVRNLAQRSATAAKEIKELINDSVVAVGEGTQLVGKTGQTFGELLQMFKETATMIGEIDMASQEQATAIEEVNTAVGRLEEMTNRNVALFSETSRSSAEMQGQAQQLRDQVQFFRT